MYASGPHDDSNRLGSPIAHAVIHPFAYRFCSRSGFNSGRSLAKYCDCRHDSGFDADKILGLVGSRPREPPFQDRFMEDAIVACQGGDAGP